MDEGGDDCEFDAEGGVGGTEGRVGEGRVGGCEVSGEEGGGWVGGVEGVVVEEMGFVDMYLLLGVVLRISV